MLLEQLYRAATILTGPPLSPGLKSFAELIPGSRFGLNRALIVPANNVLAVANCGRNLAEMICFGGFSRLDPRLRAWLLSWPGLVLPCRWRSPARSARRINRQRLPAQNDKTEKLDALKQHDEELKATRDAQRKSAETEAALKREIEQIGADRRKLNQDLIDTAARTRGVEAKVEATQARLAPLDENQRSIQKSLDGRRAVIGEVLAALQRIGHRAPPALIASPEDALQAVRTAMVLGAVLPEMRHQVEALANDLSALLDGAQKNRRRTRPAQRRGRLARRRTRPHEPR